MTRGKTIRRLTVAGAAGCLLLTACGTGEGTAAPPPGTTTATTASSTASSPASSSTTQPPEPSTSDSSGSGELAPVDCGEVTLNGAVHHVIATPTEAGLVGCTEAFNVIDEFAKLPADKRGEASLGQVALPSGWSCTVDDGMTANVSCSKDGLGVQTEQQA